MLAHNLHSIGRRVVSHIIQQLQKIPIFMQHKALMRAAFLAASVVCGVANASVVFDNGAYSGSQTGRSNCYPYTVFEDFTLTAGTTLTGLNWSQHDFGGGYTSTTFSVFSTQPPGTTPLFTTTVGATRTANQNPVLFGQYLGYDYSISGLSLALGAGTYYFSLYNTISDGATTWDQTSGSSATIAGRWQFYSPGNSTDFHSNENSVFQLNGTSVANVPEPGSLPLIALSLGALALRQRRTNRGRGRSSV